VIEGNLVYQNYEIETSTQVVAVKEFYDFKYHIEVINNAGVCIGSIKDYEGKNYAYNGPVGVQVDDGDIIPYDVVNGAFTVTIVNNTDAKKKVMFAIENMRGCEILA
jgi:hypothetical protein